MIKKLIRYFKMQKTLKAALAAGKAQKPREAIFILEPIFCCDELRSNPKTWKSTWSTLSEIAELIGESALAAQSKAIATQRENVTLLQQFGYDLVEHRLFKVAIPVIERALTLDPENDQLLLELAGVYEELGEFNLARAQLFKVDNHVENSFLFRYLAVFYSIMLGELEQAAKWHWALENLLDSALDDNQEAYVNMYKNVSDMLKRYKTLSSVTHLNKNDLRGWNAVINGNILLQLSEHGEAMNGRYAMFQESPEYLFECIAQLKSVLKDLQMTPQRILSLPDHDSLVLANLASKYFQCPVEIISKKTKSLPGLVVCYNSNSLSAKNIDLLSDAHEGQIFWCHAADWTKDSIAPDIISYFVQYTTAPWDKRTVLENLEEAQLGAPPKFSEIPALTGTYDEIIEKLQKMASFTEPDNSPIIAELTDHLFRMENGEATLFDKKRIRTKQWSASPVLSSRFFH